MNFHHNINCPDCSHPIPIETTLLLAGQSFSCSNPQCHVSITLSSTEVDRVANAFDQLSSLREDAIKHSGQDEVYENQPGG